MARATRTVAENSNLHIGSDFEDLLWRVVPYIDEYIITI
jgi:hypothetical protein